MNQRTRNTLHASEKAVKRLVEECRKSGPLSAENPKAVAQVSRTGKWLLNALAALRRELDAPCAQESRQSS